MCWKYAEQLRVYIRFEHLTCFDESNRWLTEQPCWQNQCKNNRFLTQQHSEDCWFLSLRSHAWKLAAVRTGLLRLGESWGWWHRHACRMVPSVSMLQEFCDAWCLHLPFIGGLRFLYGTSWPPEQFCPWISQMRRSVNSHPFISCCLQKQILPPSQCDIHPALFSARNGILPARQ